MPEEDPPHQPHDKLFKAGLGEAASAAAFLRGELPPEVSARIDWGRLRREPASFVDSHMTASESDLLFSAPLAGGGERQAFVYVLLEHQSSRDSVIALRLLRYMVKIWERFLEGNPRAGGVRLPVIVPVVVAQDTRPWGIEPVFSAPFDLEGPGASDLRGFVPDFAYRLFDLAVTPFVAIRGTPAGVLVLRVLKAERQAGLLGDAVWDEELLGAVPPSVIELIVRYILCADVDREAFEARLDRLRDPETQARAMNLAQQYRQEGRQEGVLTSLREAVVEALGIRFGAVPDGLAERVAEVGDEARLRDLHRVAILAPTPDDFASQL
jgi:predicted transposase/invertase (TIGR01784 family)